MSAHNPRPGLGHGPPQNTLRGHVFGAHTPVRPYRIISHPCGHACSPIGADPCVRPLILSSGMRTRADTRVRPYKDWFHGRIRHHLILQGNDPSHHGTKGTASTKVSALGLGLLLRGRVHFPGTRFQGTDAATIGENNHVFESLRGPSVLPSGVKLRVLKHLGKGGHGF